MLHEFLGLRAAPYASAELGDFFADFFAAKNARDLDRTMSFFSPDLRTYTDATLGWNLTSFAVLRALYAQYMPTWGPNARSEPTHIFGHGPRVALAFTDSPELFGAELRILGVVDLGGGELARWVADWNGRAVAPGLYHQLRAATPARPPWPDAGAELPTGPADAALSEAFSQGDAATIEAALAPEAILKDLPLQLTIRGRAAITRFLTATLPLLPYGHGVRWATSLPATSGAAEWTPPTPAWPAMRGLTTVGRNARGEIERLDSMYDARLIPDEQLATLLRATL